MSIGKNGPDGLEDRLLIKGRMMKENEVKEK